MNQLFAQNQIAERNNLTQLCYDFQSPNTRSIIHLFNPYLSINFQQMFLRIQAAKAMQFRNVPNQSIYPQANYVMSEQPIKMKEDEPSTKLESETCKLEPTIKVENVQNLPETPPDSTDKSSSAINLKKELEKILNFVLTHMGKPDESALQNFRNLYLNNPSLLEIFDKLTIKYFSAKKSKEDTVRYILRKAFKAIRASIMRKENVGSREASILLCKKYFQGSLDENSYGEDSENAEEILEFFFPYQKNSKNKTMNKNFVDEIFSSEEFCQEYKHFLEGFANILHADNRKKKEKFIRYLLECIKKNSISKLGTYNRLPWLEIWMDDTKDIANRLMSKDMIYKYKKHKN